MKITLRTKTNKKQTRKSLYIDYYSKNFRKKESLKLYIELPPYQIPKEIANSASGVKKYIKNIEATNRKNILLAQEIRTVQEAKYLRGKFEIQDLYHKNRNFIDFFNNLTEERKDNAGNYGNWLSTSKYLIKYRGINVPFGQINVRWIEGFKHYLLHDATTKHNTKLSRNTAYSYFNKLKCALKTAHKQGLTSKNFGTIVKGIKQPSPIREFLTLDELRTAFTVECEAPLYKKAFIFGCLCGVRFCDIQSLKWKQILYSEELGWYIRFCQHKTKEALTLPISNDIINLIGEPKGPEEPVFNNLKYSAWNNTKLQKWIYQSGINKRITFHCSRHSYATLQLSLGTDITTVSKMLGHKELRTTMIYAKIIDKKKIEAAHRITL